MSIKEIEIGVLDIQGSVKEHMDALRKIGVRPISVKTKNDLDRIHGLIIPGGESTTIGKLLKASGLFESIQKRARAGTLTIWGTCAGAILLAKKIVNLAPQNLRLMDIEIERNAYGRQTDSFEAEIKVTGIGKSNFPGIFIRAPRVTKTSPKVKILARYEGFPVILEQNNLLATMFHPELTQDTRIHKYFLSLVKRNA